MKREGRQHGMVRSYLILPSPLNPRPNIRIINRSDSPPTSGIFMKVSSKPTNHSKFTGKCEKPRCPGCHLHPACKSKDKTKGAQKHKHLRVMDELDSDFSGLSATVTLDNIFNDYYMEEEGIDQVDYHDNNKCISEIGLSFQTDQVEDQDWVLVESRS